MFCQYKQYKTLQSAIIFLGLFCISKFVSAFFKIYLLCSPIFCLSESKKNVLIIIFFILFHLKDVFKFAWNVISNKCNKVFQTYFFNILRHEQNGWHFANTFSNAFSWKIMQLHWLQFHWSLFLIVELTIIQLWFRFWPGTKQATSHYLNQWWPSCF